jgi:hypothetical protein
MISSIEVQSAWDEEPRVMKQFTSWDVGFSWRGYEEYYLLGCYPV